MVRKTNEVERLAEIHLLPTQLASEMYLPLRNQSMLLEYDRLLQYKGILRDDGNMSNVILCQLWRLIVRQVFPHAWRFCSVGGNVSMEALMIECIVASLGGVNLVVAWHDRGWTMSAACTKRELAQMRSNAARIERIW